MVTKTQKTVDVWIASDGSEHATQDAAELHEMAEKALSWGQRLNQAVEEERRIARVVQAEWDAANPEEAAARNSAFLERIRTNHLAFMQSGIDNGWWMGAKPNGDPIPNPVVIKISELEPNETTMAHIMAKLEVFSSVSEARRNGWDKPIVVGEFWVKKKTMCIRIEE